ncbi:hypothetical protein HLRTI_002258 [Halorhabdus tiamatea SARL4B]|uniref:Uncharacterized protein n=1 Tax=Halorhabdus tiamatea SARL4B TaxID=1033806 RepID=F7PFA1_9EURY|nr:hypothetical protein [Halorhabdus tiamatea]ERJ05731.1 hypothetical protein HLRTI_002258 [Halorhabdus tiamatea SARL4B]CCQ33945.1 conserved hypothetical protein [Halorhabdus tiamatea SARL4B]
MVRLGPDDVELDDGEQLLRSSDAAQSGWEQTLEDVEAMARDRAESGFETLILTSDNTTPKPPEADDTDEWGLVYIVPSNQAKEYEDFAEDVAFTETVVYQATSSGHAFVVTECIDPERERTLFVAGTYRLQHAAPLVEAALERGEMYTHVKKLDGTEVASIAHDDAEQFFPDPDEYTAYSA